MIHRTLLAFALVAPAAWSGDLTVYKCVDAEGRVSFGDTACPVSVETREVGLHQAPTVGWDSRGIAAANADLLMEHQFRLDRQRAAAAYTPVRQGFADRIRDRELRMRADTIRAEASRHSGLASWGLSQQAGELERQRGALWRWPTGR